MMNIRRNGNQRQRRMMKMIFTKTIFTNRIRWNL